MATMTVSIQQFHGNPASVEQAAMSGPVFVADDGSPTLVVLNMDEYLKLGGQAPPRKSAPYTDTRPFRSLADAFSSTCLTEADQDFELETTNDAPNAEAKPFRSLADLFSIPGLTAEAADFEFPELEWETAPADFA